MPESLPPIPRMEYYTVRYKIHPDPRIKISIQGVLDFIPKSTLINEVCQGIAKDEHCHIVSVSIEDIHTL